MSGPPAELLPHVIELAQTAGEHIMAVYATDFAVTQKGDASPVTVADVAAHAAILEGLGRLTPSLPVLSEEATPQSFAQRRAWSRYWLVDPLDGTREFVKHNGEFTVNIALIEGHAVVLGVVYAPALAWCYFAVRGQGAFRRAHGRTAPIRVRACDPAHTVVVGSRSHGGATLNNFLEKLGPHDIIGMGSSLKMCLVAEGKADIYPRLGTTSEWDTAAAQCVVEEAGGQVVDTDLQPLRYNTRESLLNPHFLVFGDATRDWSQYL